ncbi:DUF1801 domain-containing protein [Siccirubricoccus phaeus]|uniref:DUF1801 domain-containing protein n=1 Tax=Siccirubricoccus phaeus TaxID=2595053 RepID=UPI0011F37213|nr:DUF1801 domain-containing protein [Siccirubricoccus phaeus]
MTRPKARTQPNVQSVDAFLAGLADAARRADAIALREIMERVSGEPAVMWGGSLVGFGAYRYSYESGREGSMARVSFSPRAKELVLYGMGGFPEYENRLQKLGKHRTGKACLYIGRLADVDGAVLEELLSETLRYLRERYPPDE